MRLFGSTKKKSTVLSPEMAAATLAACVMTDAETNGMPELDDVQLRSFGTLLHLTKAAIITNWLRTLVERLSGPQRLRASSILKEFELVMYGDAPNDEAKQLAAELARLTKQTTKLIQILENKTLPELEKSRQALGWSKEWLSPIFEDEDLLKRTCLFYGPILVLEIHGSVDVLGKSVEMVVFPKDDK